MHYPKPFIPWCGGKRHLISTVLPLIPDRFNTFHSAFLGGGALELAILALKRHQSAHLADINPRLITQYQSVQRSPDEVVADISRLEELADHSAARVAINAGLQTPGLLIWLVTRSFSGLYRENRSGDFNVSFDSAKKRPTPSLARLKEASAILADVTVQCQGFEATLAKAQEGDLVLVDPPYYRTYGNYHKVAWQEAHTHRLLEVIRETVERGAIVILTETTEVLPLVHALPVAKTIVEKRKGHVINGARRVKTTEVVVKFTADVG